MMKNLIWQYDRDISETFPQSFDLCDLKSEETINFREDAKFNQVVAFLKSLNELTLKQAEQTRELIIVAIGIAERRISVLSGALFTQIKNENSFQTSEIDHVSDQIYDCFKTGKIICDFGRSSWYRPLIKLYFELPIADLIRKVNELLLELSNCIGKKQFDLNAGKNAWILKPGGKSRGRGIEIHTDFDDLLKSIMVSKDTIWITQKYIEKPLIIIGKKFDMRVWVLVSSVEPLHVWMF